MYTPLEDSRTKNSPYAYGIEDIESAAGTQQSASQAAASKPAYESWTAEQVWLLLRDHKFDDAVCNDFLSQGVDGQRFGRLSYVELQPPLFRGDQPTRQRLFELIVRCTQGAGRGAPTPIGYQSNFAGDSQTQGGTSGWKGHELSVSGEEELVESSTWGDLYVGRTSGRFVLKLYNRVTACIVLLPPILALAVFLPASIVGGLPIYVPFIIASVFLLFMLFAFYSITKGLSEFRFTPTHVYFIKGYDVERSVPNTDVKSVCITVGDVSNIESRTYGIYIKVKADISVMDSDKLAIGAQFKSIDRARVMGQKLAQLLRTNYEEGFII